MGKLRLFFAKEGRAVYISHLDLLRTFQRVFIRQGLVLRHSQGFHPHPILSFALPLSVGQASVCEILDFEVDADLDGAGLVPGLNRFMPEGVRALAGAVEEVRDLLLGESVVIQKRTKRKAMADVDIRPLLHSLALSEEPGALVLEAVVSAQNPGLNPALLAGAVELRRPHLRPDFVQIRRLEVLDGTGGVFR